MTCKICGSKCNPYGVAEVLGKYQASFSECSTCDFIFVDNCTWLEEAYKDAINETDVGYLQRNYGTAEDLKQFLATTSPDDYFVDYGAGYGAMVRLMRDRGYKFHWHDKYCKNLFAHFLEAEASRIGSYRAMVAVEVFEHLIDPTETLEDMLTFTNAIFFTTELIPTEKPKLNDWWYFGLEHGQHLSFYTEPALHKLADKYGLRYRRLTDTWHLLAKPDDSLLHDIPQMDITPSANRFSRRLVKFIARKLPSNVNQKAIARKSLTLSDHDKIKNIIETKSGFKGNLDSYNSSA
ncbi:class I SAM-dependent methyltransferase [Rubellicoccus peritrichatus]|uniref:Class I SAM-dependent methyltransferase n=1 Tax=Rubellicoccus peritrichatus TaxID=3080537 RepID=A0AAQ3L8S5_9BACT|nr:class I SAM-dependent methyltransferase [Puniceicoccus sp. CR14]WOO41435.1 class I SAM-dependent methyltransferase [Puniceicoccus sp. CR14]